MTLATAWILILASPWTALAGEELSVEIDDDYGYLQGLFEHFHANPELSMQETETATRLATELQAAGFEVTRNIGSTGLVGVMKNGNGPTVMIRADMDGLPLEENSGVPYASEKRQINLKGQEMPVMHACGHDMHMTSLVGTARRLAARKDEWRGTVMLLGQPGEESVTGAKAMVDDRLYQRVGRPDYALAMHVSSGYPAGKIAIGDGLVYSSIDTLKIIVHGIGAHGASPHRGRDPVVIASQIVLALQTIVTREVSPLVPSIITVGAFHAGTAPNIISDKAILDVTVRANEENTRAMLLASIERVATNIGRSAGLPEDRLPEVIKVVDGAPTTVNDAALAGRVRDAVVAQMGEAAIVPYVQSGMGAEDFPYLVMVDPPIPSVYFRVGGTWQTTLDSAANGGPAVAGHHSPLFRIEPEPSIKAGVEAMTAAALALLDRPQTPNR
jgi:hippurate hydrolase